jgi:serine/threonine protein kinase
LERDFWPRAREWESLLLNHLTRKDFHEFFKPIKKIGRGNFATVYLAQDRRVNRFTAIKAFMKEYAFKGDGKAAIENEVRIMRKLKSSNIATLYGVY